MFFYSYSTFGEFSKIVKKNRHKFSSGVVHQFTGSEAELEALLALDLYIGVNLQSLKTK
jgi:TatD DNase family protein